LFPFRYELSSIFDLLFFGDFWEGDKILSILDNFLVFVNLKKWSSLRAILLSIDFFKDHYIDSKIARNEDHFFKLTNTKKLSNIDSILSPSQKSPKNSKSNIEDNS
jgi:hypothetical protein